MKKLLLPLPVLALLALAAAAPEGAPAPAPAPVPASAPAVAMPGFHPNYGRYEVRMTGSNGAEIAVTAVGPVDPEKLRQYSEAMRKETQREIHFNLLWDETVTPGESGGAVIRRVMKSATVERTVAGAVEPGPLPIDYQDSVLELTISAAGALTGRTYTAPRLNPGEKEILEQFFDVEPFPDLPAALAPDAVVERSRTQKISFESQVTEQTTTDRYRTGEPAALQAEKIPMPPGGQVLRLERDIAIGGGGGLNPIRTPAPGRFVLALGPDGLLMGCTGKYELGFLEILPMPPELLPAAPEPPPEPAPDVKRKPTPAASAPASAPARAPATAPPEGKLKWNYRLPGVFSFARRVLPAVAPPQPAEPASPPAAPAAGAAEKKP